MTLYNSIEYIYLAGTDLRNKENFTNSRWATRPSTGSGEEENLHHLWALVEEED